MSEEKKEKAVFDITTLDINFLIELFINILSTQAWQYMGLRTKTGTDKIEIDLEKAKLAIDCITFLTDKLELYISKDEADKLRNMLLDLQTNFVRKKEEK
ncbi:MAG: DUF1844 domain-containing protein [Candidatus Bathyarchaeota archaeon]